MAHSGSRDEIEILKEQNRKLQQRAEAAEAAASGAEKFGYLWCYRPHAGLFEREWEQRFVCIVSKKIMVFSKEQNPLVGTAHEAASFRGPRFSVDIPSCTLVDEGPRRGGKYHVFHLRNQNEDVLLRLSTGYAADRILWFKALENAGVKVDKKMPYENEMTSSRSSNARAGLRHRRGGSKAGETEKNNDEPNAENKDGQNTATVEDAGSGSVFHKLRSLQRESESESRDKDFAGNNKDKKFKTPFTNRPGIPAHRKLRFSILSSEMLDTQKHAGLVNLAFVIIVATNVRQILENLLKYGFSFRPMRLLFSEGDHQLLPFAGLIAMNCLLAFGIQKLIVISSQRKSQLSLVLRNLLPWMHVVNVLVMMIIPPYAILLVAKKSGIFANAVFSATSQAFLMKVWSWVHTNHDLSKGGLEDKAIAPTTLIAGVEPEEMIRYPDNVNFRNFAYFFAAPTLCYQPVYPRSSGVRKPWLARRIVELVFFVSLMLLIFDQHIVPAVEAAAAVTLRPGSSNVKYIGVLFQKLLVLAVPTMYFWLAGFYSFFHLFLNIIAELLRFGDREFYRDWWNSTTLDQYWKSWNIPVHKWLVRHMYFPMIRKGYKKSVAAFLVFFYSAVMHEIIIGVPCRVMRAWAFIAMLMQVPLTMFTQKMQKKLKREYLGNMFFWMTFCILGQPVCLVLYYASLKNENIL